MERRLKTPDLFKFPYFEAICWYVAKNLLETLKGESQMLICTHHRDKKKLYYIEVRCFAYQNCQKIIINKIDTCKATDRSICSNVCSLNDGI